MAGIRPAENRATASTALTRPRPAPMVGSLGPLNPIRPRPAGAAPAGPGETRGRGRIGVLGAGLRRRRRDAAAVPIEVDLGPRLPRGAASGLCQGDQADPAPGEEPGRRARRARAPAGVEPGRMPVVEARWSSGGRRGGRPGRFRDPAPPPAAWPRSRLPWSGFGGFGGGRDSGSGAQGGGRRSGRGLEGSFGRTGKEPGAFPKFLVAGGPGRRRPGARSRPRRRFDGVPATMTAQPARPALAVPASGHGGLFMARAGLDAEPAPGGGSAPRPNGPPIFRRRPFRAGSGPGRNPHGHPGNCRGL
jgi:hypothetical protein